MPTYKDEKTGLWYCKFVFTDWLGNKKQKKKMGFKLQKDAKIYEFEFLSKENASCDMSFSSMVSLYMEDCKARLKPTTYEGKEFLFNAHVLPFFRSMPINTITATTIRKWQTEMISKKNKYSATYLKAIHNQVSAIFNYASKYYKLAENPARVCGSMGKKNADAMKFWMIDEFSQFVSTVEDKLMSKTIFNLLFWSGMRSGELLALTLNDFDFDAQTVSISKNYARVKRQDYILPPKMPKSKRKITLPPFLCDIVKEYVEKLVCYDPGHRLFNVTKNYIRSEMVRGCKKSGVKKIRVHDLRHSHASLLIEMGFSPLLLSERLGHEDIKTTLQTYSHLYPNKQAEVAEKLQMLH